MANASRSPAVRSGVRSCRYALISRQGEITFSKILLKDLAASIDTIRFFARKTPMPMRQNISTT